MNTTTGKYRAIKSIMIDHDEYQLLPSAARLTLLTLRLCPQNNIICMYRLYPEILAHQTGIELNKTSAAIKELERANWIDYEDDMVWIINGLKHDPLINLNNSKHRIAIQRDLLSLPNRAIVERFCNYYNIDNPHFKNKQDAIVIKTDSSSMLATDATIRRVFDRLKAAYPVTINTTDNPAYRSVRDQLKIRGIDPDELIRAAQSYCKHVEMSNTIERHIMGMQRFYGREDVWRKWVDYKPKNEADQKMERRIKNAQEWVEGVENE